MIQTITGYDFRNAFNSSDTYKNNFSYAGLNALFAYLEEYETDTGEQIEFDMVALCYEYTEYKNLAELQANYTDITSMEDLEDNTAVIRIGNGESFIIADY